MYKLNFITDAYIQGKKYVQVCFCSQSEASTGDLEDAFSMEQGDRKAMQFSPLSFVILGFKNIHV